MLMSFYMFGRQLFRRAFLLLFSDIVDFVRDRNLCSLVSCGVSDMSCVN